MSLEKYDVNGDGTETGGNLDVEGTGNIDGDFTILKDDADPTLTKFKITAASGNLSTLGTMTSQGDIKLHVGAEDKHHLKDDGTLTSVGLIKSKSSLEVNTGNGAFKDADSKFSVDSSGNLIASGTGTFTSNVISGDATGTHVKLEASTGKISGKLLTVGDATAQLEVLSNGNVNIDKNLTVTGTLSVGDISTLGTVTQIDTEHLHVKDSMIMLADGNTADLLDIGFIGKSSAGHHGLVRDSDDSIFKLFQNSSEDLSSDNSVNFNDGSLEYGHLYLNKITLQGDGKKFIGDLEGTADKADELTTNRSFSIGTSATDNGDITATGVNFNGTADVELSATINSGVVDFAHLNDAAVVLSTETLAGSATSDVTIPTSKAVADYVASKVSSGGFSNVSNMDLQMGYVEDDGQGGTTESFVRVYETVVLHKVKDHQNGGVSVFNEETNQIILINGIDTGSGFGTNAEFDSKLDNKIMLFVNGQKLRIGTQAEVEVDGTADYYLMVQPAALPGQTGERSCIKFSADTIAINDELEIRYYNKY